MHTCYSELHRVALNFLRRQAQILRIIFCTVLKVTDKERDILKFGNICRSYLKWEVQDMWLWVTAFLQSFAEVPSINVHRSDRRMTVMGKAWSEVSLSMSLRWTGHVLEMLPPISLQYHNYYFYRNNKALKWHSPSRNIVLYIKSVSALH